MTKLFRFLFLSVSILLCLSVSDAGSQPRGGGLPYKIYSAFLSQSGSSAPVATVKQNTLGGTVVWGRYGPGDYKCTLSGAFPDGKFTPVFGSLSAGGNIVSPGITITFLLARTSDNELSLAIYGTDGNQYDGSLAGHFLEFRVYP